MVFGWLAALILGYLLLSLLSRLRSHALKKKVRALACRQQRSTVLR
jgi:hypothetical protein